MPPRSTHVPRFALSFALASAVLLSLPAVACTDEPPTAVGVDLFPGTLPSTFQVVLPPAGHRRRPPACAGRVRLTGAHDPSSRSG